MIAGGGKTDRSTHFLAALSACRHSPVVKAFRQRPIDAGAVSALALRPSELHRGIPADLVAGNSASDSSVAGDRRRRQL